MSLERMQKARTGLIVNEPFFGTLALRLDLKEDPKTKTSWTDGKTLGFNPEWSSDLPMHQLEAVFAHHVLTCALGHHLRRGGRDPKTWNDASDYAVNTELKKAGFALPDGSLLDPQYDGLHTEAIYSALHQQPDDSGQSGGSGVGQGGQGQSSPKGQPQPGEQSQGQQPDAGAEAGEGQPQSGKGSDATGDVRDAPGEDGGEADEASIAEQEADWQIAVAQAAQIARGAGKLPGGIERDVLAFLNPKVSWREALQRYFQRRSKDDYNWSRPNRRYLSSGIYLPSLDSQRVGTIAWAIDLSGSITQVQIDQFAAEMEEVRISLRPEKVLVMLHDTLVRGEVLTFSPEDEIIIKTKAGGGTAFDDPPRKLEELSEIPEVLVYLTDLDGSRFGPEPDYPVLWVSTLKEKAPFGEVIMMQ